MSEQSLEEVNRLAEPAPNGEKPEALERDVDLTKEKATFELDNPVTVDGKLYTEVTFDFVGTPNPAFEKIIKTYKRLHPGDETAEMFQSEEFQDMMVSRACNLPMAVIQAFQIFDRIAVQQKVVKYLLKRLAMKLIRVG